MFTDLYVFSKSLENSAISKFSHYVILQNFRIKVFYFFKQLGEKPDISLGFFLTWFSSILGIS